MGHVPEIEHIFPHPLGILHKYLIIFVSYANKDPFDVPIITLSLTKHRPIANIPYFLSSIRSSF